MIIFARQQLMKLARDFQEDGSVPALVDDARLYRIRSASALLQEGEDWQAATAQARDADAGVPLSWVSLFD